MKIFARPIRYLQARAARSSFILVLFCGGMLGYFLLRTFASPAHRQYQLDFGDAVWIEPAETAPVAYFRKEIFLNARPEQAWLEVAATDGYKVIINDSLVGAETSLKTRLAQIYDIKKFLASGTNVIAIAVNRNSYPGSAQLLARGEFKEPGGRAKSFFTDEHWKVIPRTGGVDGSEGWVSPLVPQEVWPDARRVTGLEQPVDIAWVDTNPLLLQLPASGNWIVASNAGRESIFSGSIVAQSARAETWLQVASSGNLDLLVNGKLITSTASSEPGPQKIPGSPRGIVEPSEEGEVTPPPEIIRPPQNAKALATPSPSPTPDTNATVATPAPYPINRSESVLSFSQKPALEAYDISYWIRKGPNTIVAAVRNNQRPASFLANGFTLQRDGSIQQFETDSDWRVSDQRSGQQQPALQSGPNGSAPWGYLAQQLGKPLNPSDVDAVVRPMTVILLTIVAIVALWLLASRFVAEVRQEPLRYTLFRDALFHAPIALGLVFLLLPRYDWRFPVDWPFRPQFMLAAALALLAVRLLHFIRRTEPAVFFRAPRRLIQKPVSLNALPYLLLALIIGLGFAFRYHDLGFISFDHDEFGLVEKSGGIWTRGFPYREVVGTIRPATTYELVTYPLAISSLFFGDSEWAMRLPACLMGTLSIGIIALLGRRLFNWRTGLISAFIYACLPLDIRWAQNCFHPQQCQFFTLITFWLFYEAITVRPLNRKYLTAAAVSFCAAYLSWEGSGFILPALFLGLVVVRWREWWWIKEFHLYRCVFFMMALVIAQFCWRTLASAPYTQIGFGLSSSAGPSLFFEKYGWQPMYYVDHLLLSENHVFFTLMALVGLPFCWRDRGFRYVFTGLVTLLFCHTNLIAALSTRYCIYYQPLLVLTGVAAGVTLYDRLLLLSRRTGRSAIARGCAHATGLAVILLLFVQSNEWLLKLYSLASPGASPGLMTRLNTYRYDHRGAAAYVKSHLQPGDLLVVGVPHVFEYYSGISGNYSIDTIFIKKITYNGKFAEPRFMDKFRGYPTIRSLKEMREVVSRGRRIWLIFVPYGGYSKLNSPELRLYLSEKAKVVFESYRAKVLLIGGETQQDLAAGYSAE